jgi:hypothetical protein
MLGGDSAVELCVIVEMIFADVVVASPLFEGVTSRMRITSRLYSMSLSSLAL